MPRIRTLKPEHRQHRKTGALDHITYRLWIGMMLDADDEGRLVCDAEQLRVTIFGYHVKVTGVLIESSLSILTEVGLLRLYVVGGIRYAWFPSWHDHQVINRPTPSKLPPYDDSVSIHGSVTDDSRGKGMEGKGMERNGRRAGISDEEFIQSLRDNHAYRGIDLDSELGKMDAWFLTPKGKGRKKTRAFILRWLNKTDRPVTVNGNHQTSQVPFGYNVTK